MIVIELRSLNEATIKESGSQSTGFAVVPDQGMSSLAGLEELCGIDGDLRPGDVCTHKTAC